MMGNQPRLSWLVCSERRVKDLGVRAQNLLELVEPLLKLTTVSGTQAWLLALPVLAVSAIAAAPPTRGLTAVALYLQHAVLASAS